MANLLGDVDVTVGRAPEKDLINDGFGFETWFRVAAVPFVNVGKGEGYVEPVGVGAHYVPGTAHGEGSDLWEGCECGVVEEMCG